MAVAAADRALSTVPAGFLAGEWREPAGGETFAVQNPATTQEIARVADCSAADALLALDAAETAQPEWAARSPRERATILRKLEGLLRDERERLAHILSLEVGKTLAEARGEVDYAADFLLWYAEEAVRGHGRSTAAPDGASQIVTVAEPVGPALLITPWNVPLAMAARKVGPALAAGCTAILKPPDLTPLSSLVFAELALRAGLPGGVLSVMPTTRAAEMSRVLMADPRLRTVSFTGSTPVGRTLIAQSSDRVLRVSMELGGNAAFIVFDDADLEIAVREAFLAKMRAGGQSCVAANRFLVQDGIADAFVTALAARMSAVVTGPPLDESSDLGPLVDGRAVHKARRLVDDAVARGATVVMEGRIPQDGGHYFPPTVLDRVPEDAAIMAEEVFGPVAAIHRFRDEEDAIRIANDTEHGLAGYVVSQNIERATRVGARLETGMVGINRGLVSNVAAPFGGIKASGLGREGGPEGLDEYLVYKYYSVPRARAAVSIHGA